MEGLPIFYQVSRVASSWVLNKIKYLGEISEKKLLLKCFQRYMYIFLINSLICFCHLNGKSLLTSFGEIHKLRIASFHWPSPPITVIKREKKLSFNIYHYLSLQNVTPTFVQGKCQCWLYCIHLKYAFTRQCYCHFISASGINSDRDCLIEFSSILCHTQSSPTVYLNCFNDN